MAPLPPVLKFSTDLTVCFSSGTLVPPDVTMKNLSEWTDSFSRNDWTALKYVHYSKSYLVYIINYNIWTFLNGRVRDSKFKLVNTKIFWIKMNQTARSFNLMRLMKQNMKKMRSLTSTHKDAWPSKSSREPPNLFQANGLNAWSLVKNQECQQGPSWKATSNVKVAIYFRIKSR